MSNLDRPLSEIIKDNNPRSGSRGGRGRGGSRGSRGGFRGARGAPRGGSSFRGTGFRTQFRGGGKAPATGGGGPIRRDRAFSRPQTAPYQQRSMGGGLSAGSKIMLTNLDPQLTEDDCLEIFQNVGPVTRTIIHYNRDGTSQGTAEVHFANKNDALRAVDEYDMAQIDGRTMYVKVIANKAPTVVQRPPVQAPPTTLFSIPTLPAVTGNFRAKGAFNSVRGRGGSRGSGFRRGSGNQRGGRGGAFRSRGRGRGGARGGKQPTPSASELDADMDKYYSHDSNNIDMIAAGQPANPAVAKS